VYTSLAWLVAAQFSEPLLASLSRGESDRGEGTSREVTRRRGAFAQNTVFAAHAKPAVQARMRHAADGRRTPLTFLVLPDVLHNTQPACA
jgi:hypothetical protein